MKNKRLHIQQVLTLVLLWVFALAIIPWGSLHHHEELVTTAVEKNCTHKLHFKVEQDNCLICKAHFEKNYTHNQFTFITYLDSEVIVVNEPIVISSYTELISTSLRGPPIAS